MLSGFSKPRVASQPRSDGTAAGAREWVAFRVGRTMARREVVEIGAGSGMMIDDLRRGRGSGLLMSFLAQLSTKERKRREFQMKKEKGKPTLLSLSTAKQVQI